MPAVNSYWGIALGHFFRSSIPVKLFIMIAALFAFVSIVTAQAFYETNYFGNQISILKANGCDNYEMNLILNEQSLLCAQYISIDNVNIINGIGVVTGLFGCNGTSCGKSSWVISFPKAEPPRVDISENVPLYKTQINSDTITYFGYPDPVNGQTVYTWTPEDGFVQQTSLDVKADETRGWEVLRQRYLKSPSDVFTIASLKDAIFTRLNNHSDLDEFTVRLTNGPPSQKYLDGGNYVGSTCIPHSCSESGGFVYLDAKKKEAFIAWRHFDDKTHDSSVLASPDLKLWPKAANNFFAKWKRDGNI